MEQLREELEEVYELRCCRLVDEGRRGSERSARAGGREVASSAGKSRVKSTGDEAEREPSC